MDPGAGTILIVEDEPLIRFALAEIVADLGLTSLKAASAAEALGILEAGNNISIVLTDVRMPGPIDGLNLASLVREKWPAIRIVITSGHLSPSSISLPDDVAFLAKPFRVEALLRVLEDFITG